MRYAITDIETTGSHASGNSIIEIAVIVWEDNEIVEEFQTLINPGIKLPLYITTLTGITDQMLVGAPTFEVIADDLLEVLKDAIFVAHNVSFDYSFVKASFEHVGLTWAPPKLDSIKLARKAFPGLRSYGLANICLELNIRNEAAHRAMGDARATLTLFDKCMALIGAEDVMALTIEKNKAFFLPAHLDRESFEALPTTTGVYHLLNKQNKPIYIGKAKNIKKRVYQHFSSAPKSARMQAFMADVCAVTYEETGTEILALLIEDQRIRTHWPKHNGAQKKRPQHYHILRYTDQLGYERLGIQNGGKYQGVVRSFNSSAKTTAWLYQISNEGKLDPRLLGLQMFDMHQALPEVEEHNNALERALRSSEEALPILLLKGKGRKENEHSFIYIDRHVIKGYGFIAMDSDMDWQEYMINIVPTEVNAAMAIRLVDSPYPYHTQTLTQQKNKINLDQ
jgi:DNA polymerase III subunit epsilon